VVYSFVIIINYILRFGKLLQTLVVSEVEFSAHQPEFYTFVFPLLLAMLSQFTSLINLLLACNVQVCSD
jgi:hypothetical protein